MLENGINLNIRRILFWLVSVIVMVAAIMWLYNYLMSAPVTLSTSGPGDTVKIAGVLGEKNGSFSKQAIQKLHVRVRAGRYEISAYDKQGASSTSRIITVKARKAQSFTLNLSKLVSTDPVYGKDVTAVVADSSQLIFIDKSTGNLERVDTAGNITALATLGFASAKWANPGLGVAQSSDGTLYIIKNGSVNPLQLPFKTTYGQNISYDVSKDGQVYVAFGGNVYSGDGGGTFKKIYSASGSNIIVSAGMGSVAVLEPASSASADEGGAPKKQGDGRLSVLTGQNKLVKDVTGVNNIAWSPGGKYLLATGRATTTVFDNQLRTKSSLYINNASLYTWSDDSTIFYGIANAGSQLWAYDLNAQRSHEVALLNPSENITDIYPSSDGSYIYMSVQSNQDTQLSKAPLKGQPTDKTLSTLNIFLPEDIGVCTLNYVNFIKPVMTILYPNSGVSPDQCVAAAKAELRSYSIYPGKFNFTTTPYEAE